jgi:alkylation response protein AidB-like acyl-CoA dehydrogenase
VQTRASRTDDGWLLNGQKVWTTLAQYADFGMLLARTDPDVPKHAGLTMFIVPMHAEGVTVRPLRQVSGEAHFNEVFFDDVVLDDGATLGPVDGGWGVACATLMFERLALLAAFEQFGWSAEQFVAPIVDHPAIAESDVRQRIAGLTSDLLALRYSGYRILTALTRGDVPSVEAGIGKISVIEAGMEGASLIAELLGPDALEDEWGPLSAELLGLRSGGGTDEIIRNTLGDRVLGLPPEPRVDKDRPFREVSGGRKEVPA